MPLSLNEILDGRHTKGEEDYIKKTDTFGKVERRRKIKIKEWEIMNRKIDEKTTMQVVIDKGLHRLLKIESAKSGRSIRELVEECLAEYLAIDKRHKHRL